MRGGCRGVQGVQRCWGGVQGVAGGVQGTVASLLRSNIQDFVQEVLVGQMAQGTPSQCLPWPTPPPNFKVLGGGKGEVKPPKCPTRHQGSADILYQYVSQILHYFTQSILHILLYMLYTVLCISHLCLLYSIYGALCILHHKA